MSMKTTRLVTYWNAGEAHDVIEFLDTLRDQLWETYGDQIIAMRLEAEELRVEQADQIQLAFDQEEPF